MFSTDDTSSTSKSTDSTPNNQPTIDKKEAHEHLRALGYSNAAEVYIRAFFPKDDARCNDPKQARKATGLSWQELEKWQFDGRGIYFVVNGGGHKDKDVTVCRAIFIEHDDLDKETQRELWRYVDLPEPTLQVDSGGKSIHSYWVFEQPIPVNQWRELQRDLLEYAQGDRSLKNPSRVMRLAGAWHVSSKGYVQSRIITHSGQRYSYSELRSAIPVAQPLPKISPTVGVTGSGVPLESCLTLSDRQLIEQGVSEGGRNSNGAKLARNLIGTASRLVELGISFDGSPRQIFDDYCGRCTPPLDTKEAEIIWRSASKDNPTPSLTDDALAVCIQAWEKKHRTCQPNQQPKPRSWVGRIKDTAVETAKQILPIPKTERPPADIIAREIAEQYKDKFKFNNSIGSWMHYEVEKQGTWAIETSEYMESLIKGILDSKGITGYGSHSYITNVLKNLRCILITRTWDEVSPLEFLPFVNGVLHISSQKLLPHHPDYHLTWQLPREYNPLATGWGTIENFLNEATQGSDNLKRILLCFCNAVIKGRADLQKFIHIIGVGGTGKGTYLRLLQSLIGEENTLSTTLEDWCSNNFETANAYKKRLVVFPDEDKQTGKLGKFLSLTGEDWIRAEEKGKKAFQYRYDGMVAVASNLPIFVGDSVSRITRRAITAPFNYQPPPGLRRNLEAEFEPELSAFTNYVLSIPDEVVTNTLMGLADAPEVTAEFWENRIRTDSIAAWINDWVICDPQAKTYIGNNKFEGEGGAGVYTLFGSYVKYCHQSGFQPKAVKNFSPELLELLKTVVKWDVRKGRDNTAKYIEGIRLRIPEVDDHIPTFDITLAERIRTSAESSAESCVELNPLLSQAFEDCADSSPLLENQLQLNMDLLHQEIGEFVQDSPPVPGESDFSDDIGDEPAQPPQFPDGTGFGSTPSSGTTIDTQQEDGECGGDGVLKPEQSSSSSSSLVSSHTPLSPHTPHTLFSLHQPVEFWHLGNHEWLKGTITEIVEIEGYFHYCVVSYRAWGKNRTEKIFRADWLRSLYQ